MVKEMRGLLPDGGYQCVSLSDDDIRTGVYRKYLGGGEKRWSQRGQFQLMLLKEMGLDACHRFLDVGCGPGRASEHFIKFLDLGNYHGCDFNADFIEAALFVAQHKGLLVRSPAFSHVNDFLMPSNWPKFDYALAFSVLNHCAPQQRAFFFERIPPCLKPGGRLYVSHAAWFQGHELVGSDTRLARRFSEGDFPIMDHGWKSGETIFPILEFIRDEG